MADEFAKGLGVLTGAGMVWMVLAGWFNTPAFDGPQLVGANPENVDVYGQLALALKEVMFWFAITGALMFWVVIPMLREFRAYVAEE